MKIQTVILILIIAAAFIYLWRAGQLMRFSLYCRETWAELNKCNWPTWTELKGSTVVVMISMGLLGGFTVLMDRVFFTVLGWLTALAA